MIPKREDRFLLAQTFGSDQIMPERKDREL
jgi:hypothetical protein